MKRVYKSLENAVKSPKYPKHVLGHDTSTITRREYAIERAREKEEGERRES